MVTKSFDMYINYISQNCSFHNKLKTNPRYLAHQVNRRIDDLVGTLLKIEEDMFYDRMNKEVMKDSGEASLKREGTERHDRGMDISDSAVLVCCA